MTRPETTSTQHAEERDRIRHFSKLLIGGDVEGPRTITRLAELAGVKRWKLTHRHVDLKEEFQEQLEVRRMTPRAQEKLESALNDEKTRSAALRAENARLNRVLERYASVIAELTSDLADAQARVPVGHNIIPIRRPQ